MANRIKKGDQVVVNAAVDKIESLCRGETP